MVLCIGPPYLLGPGFTATGKVNGNVLEKQSCTLQKEVVLCTPGCSCSRESSLESPTCSTILRMESVTLQPLRERTVCSSTLRSVDTLLMSRSCGTTGV